MNLLTIFAYILNIYFSFHLISKRAFVPTVSQAIFKHLNISLVAFASFSPPAIEELTPKMHLLTEYIKNTLGITVGKMLYVQGQRPLQS